MNEDSDYSKALPDLERFTRQTLNEPPPASPDFKDAILAVSSASRGTCPRRESDETAKSSKLPYELKERVPGREWIFFDFSVGVDSIESGKGNVKSVIEPIKDSIIRLSMTLFGGAIPVLVFPIKDKMLKVQGFTDCHGKDEINTPLRTSRAESFCSVVREGDDDVAEFFQYQIKSCKGAPLDDMVTSNATVEGRRQNRSVLIQVIAEPTPVTPSRTYPYDSTYGPSRDHCLSYLGTQVHFNKAFAQNAYCACLTTPNEPHTNCVRKCLQVKRDKLILSAFNELREGTFLWCPAVWLQHRQCYKECGCDNAFIDYLLFSPMCGESFGCPAVGLSINLFNPCMKT